MARHLQLKLNWLQIVILSISVPLIVQSYRIKFEDAPKTCSEIQKVCSCGKDNVEFIVDIPRCVSADPDTAVCVPCDRSMDIEDVCSLFKDCRTCDGKLKSCSSCPPGYFGRFCQNEFPSIDEVNEIELNVIRNCLVSDLVGADKTCWLLGEESVVCSMQCDYFARDHRKAIFQCDVKEGVWSVLNDDQFYGEPCRAVELNLMSRQKRDVEGGLSGPHSELSGLHSGLSGPHSELSGRHSGLSGGSHSELSGPQSGMGELQSRMGSAVDAPNQMKQGVISGGKKYFQDVVGHPGSGPGAAYIQKMTVEGKQSPGDPSSSETRMDFLGQPRSGHHRHCPCAQHPPHCPPKPCPHKPHPHPPIPPHPHPPHPHPPIPPHPHPPHPHPPHPHQPIPPHPRPPIPPHPPIPPSPPHPHPPSPQPPIPYPPYYPPYYPPNPPRPYPPYYPPNPPRPYPPYYPPYPPYYPPNPYIPDVPGQYDKHNRFPSIGLTDVEIYEHIEKIVGPGKVDQTLVELILSLKKQGFFGIHGIDAQMLQQIVTLYQQSGFGPNGVNVDVIEQMVLMKGHHPTEDFEKKHLDMELLRQLLYLNELGVFTNHGVDLAKLKTIITQVHKYNVDSSIIYQIDKLHQHGCFGPKGVNVPQLQRVIAMVNQGHPEGRYFKREFLHNLLQMQTQGLFGPGGVNTYRARHVLGGSGMSAHGSSHGQVMRGYGAEQDQNFLSNTGQDDQFMTGYYAKQHQGLKAGGAGHHGQYMQGQYGAHQSQGLDAYGGEDDQFMEGMGGDQFQRLKAQGGHHEQAMDGFGGKQVQDLSSYGGHHDQAMQGYAGAQMQSLTGAGGDYGQQMDGAYSSQGQSLNAYGGKHDQFMQGYNAKQGQQFYGVGNNLLQDMEGAHSKQSQVMNEYPKEQILYKRDIPAFEDYEVEDNGEVDVEDDEKNQSALKRVVRAYGDDDEFKADIYKEEKNDQRNSFAATDFLKGLADSGSSEEYSDDFSEKGGISELNRSDESMSMEDPDYPIFNIRSQQRTDPVSNYPDIVFRTERSDNAAFNLQKLESGSSSESVSMQNLEGGESKSQETSSVKVVMEDTVTESNKNYAGQIVQPPLNPIGGVLYKPYPMPLPIVKTIQPQYVYYYINPYQQPGIGGFNFLQKNIGLNGLSGGNMAVATTPVINPSGAQAQLNVQSVAAESLLNSASQNSAYYIFTTIPHHLFLNPQHRYIAYILQNPAVYAKLAPAEVQGLMALIAKQDQIILGQSGQQGQLISGGLAGQSVGGMEVLNDLKIQEAASMNAQQISQGYTGQQNQGLNFQEAAAMNAQQISQGYNGQQNQASQSFQDLKIQEAMNAQQISQGYGQQNQAAEIESLKFQEAMNAQQISQGYTGGQQGMGVFGGQNSLQQLKQLTGGQASQNILVPQTNNKIIPVTGGRAPQTFPGQQTQMASGQMSQQALSQMLAGQFGQQPQLPSGQMNQQALSQMLAGQFAQQAQLVPGQIGQQAPSPVLINEQIGQQSQFVTEQIGQQAQFVPGQIGSVSRQQPQFLPAQIGQQGQMMHSESVASSMGAVESVISPGVIPVQGQILPAGQAGGVQFIQGAPQQCLPQVIPGPGFQVAGLAQAADLSGQVMGMGAQTAAQSGQFVEMGGQAVGQGSSSAFNMGENMLTNIRQVPLSVLSQRGTMQKTSFNQSPRFLVPQLENQSQRFMVPQMANMQVQNAGPYIG